MAIKIPNSWIQSNRERVSDLAKQKMADGMDPEEAVDNSAQELYLKDLNA